MSLVAFSPEEQVEAFGENWTLRLDNRAISVIEGALDLDFETVTAHLRCGRPRYAILSRVVWALFREHHPEVTIDQALAIAMDKGKDGAKVGLALDALLERAFPMAPEDRNLPNPPRKRAGRSKSSAVSG